MFHFISRKKKSQCQYSFTLFHSIILWREMYFLVYICESNIKLGEWQMTVLAHTLVLYKINPYLELRVSREILWSWYIVLMYTYRWNSQVEYNLVKKHIMHYMLTVCVTNAISARCSISICKRKFVQMFLAFIHIHIFTFHSTTHP